MARPTRILIVEDSALDAEMIERELVRSGLEPDCRRVETLEALDEAMRDPPDVVISDFQLAGFTGMDALRSVRQSAPNLPFILVSGAVGEALAVEAMRSGANDYVMKGSLDRLGPAIDRELRDAAVRAGRLRARTDAHFQRDLNRAVAEASLGFLENENLSQLAAQLVESAAELTGSTLALAAEAFEGHTPRILAVSSGTWDQLSEVSLAAEARRGIEQGGWPYPGPRRESLLFSAILHGEVVETNDPTSHPSWRGELPPGHPEIQAFLSSPLRAHGRTVGFLAVANRPGGYGSEERGVIETLASPLALAVRSCRSDLRRREAEEQLLQAQKMESVGSLAGGVAHDFNNLLVPIQGYSEMALALLEADHPARRHVSTILDASHRASELIRQLLTFSRKQVLDLRTLDLDAEIHTFARMLERIVTEDIALELELSGDGMTVRADPGQIQQVLMNLVVNATDALPRGGTIRILTTAVPREQLLVPPELLGDLPHPTWVQLTVEDDGTGMGASVRARAFDPFFTTKGRTKGTGLGLSTVYGIVSQHRGVVWIESEEGRGTAVRCAFPLCTDETTVPAPKPIAQLAENRPRRILVVEDDEGARSLIVEVLDDLGHLVTSTARASEASTILEERGPFDLLVTDVVMPELNGAELATALRLLQPDLRVLFVSGYPDETLSRKGLEKGEIRLLRKPFSLPDLTRAVDEALAAEPGG